MPIPPVPPQVPQPPFRPPHEGGIADTLEHEVVPILASLTTALEALVELHAIEVRMKLASAGIEDYAEIDKIVNRVRGCSDE